MRRSLAGRLILFAQIAGLAVMAWFVYRNWFVLLFVLRYESFVRVIATSLFYVVALWVVSTLLTFYVYLLVSMEDPREAIGLSIRSSVPGMWFAPAMLLLSGVSPASFVVSVLLAVNTARVLVSRWPIGPARALQSPRGIISAIPIRTGFLSRRTAPALIASFAILLGLVAKLWRWPLASAISLVAGAAIVTALSLLSGASNRNKIVKAPPSAFAILLTLLLASMLTVGVYRARTAESGTANSVDATKETATKLYNSGSTKESFPGVVLKTDRKKQPEISPRSLFSKSTAVTEPQTIEFSGEYWMLRPYYLLPPLNALISHSSPLDFTFHTTDSLPMKMEAHQPLERPIDLACCSAIEVMIVDGDHHAGTIGVELIVLDGARSLSLGTRMIDSERQQTLEFAVPAARSIRSFDQIEVVFHRDPMRIDRSANVSIERFVLLPAQ